MFRRAVAYLKTIEWAAIVGSALLLCFCLAVVVPAIRTIPARFNDPERGEQPRQYESANTADYETAQGRPKETADERIADYTFWLMILTGVLAISTVLLWVETNRLAALARTQASDMKAQIALARDEFNATHRPRLRVRFVRHEPMSANGDIPLRMKYAIVNIGDGVAHTIEHYTTIVLKPDGDDPVDEDYIDDSQPQEMTVATGESLNFITSKDAEIKAFTEYTALRGDGVLIFRGKITYRGGNGISRTTAWDRTYDAKLKIFRLTENSDHEYED